MPMPLPTITARTKAIAQRKAAVLIAAIGLLALPASTPATAQPADSLDLSYRAEHGAWVTRCDDSLTLLPPVCLAVAGDADGQFAIGFGLTERHGGLVPAVRIRALEGGAPIANRLLALAVDGEEIARQEGRMLDFLSQLVAVYFAADADRLVTAARTAALAAAAGGPEGMTVTIATTDMATDLAGQVALDGLHAALADLAAHHGMTGD